MSTATISPTIEIAQVNKATSAGDNMLHPERPISVQTHLAIVSIP
jgi:hypothetical protein